MFCRLLPAAALVVLGGCMEMDSEAIQSRLKLPFGQEQEQVSQGASSFVQEDRSDGSEIFDTLLARRTVIPEDSTLSHVADIALASGARASEAELRTAKLRAEAEDKNWLPTLEPTVSLTSLGDVVTGLIVEAVLYDHGRKKAEREYAASDVEVAAVTLSQDMNERVFTAQTLFVEAVKSQHKAALADRALAQMERFRKIVSGRVDGGVSDKGDLRMVDTRSSSLRTQRDTAREAAQTALSELSAMTGTSFQTADVGQLGISALPEVEALAVIKAKAESGRNIARAKVERAGQLPGIGAVASGGSAALQLVSETGIGFGTAARIKAIESTKETALLQVDEAREDSARSRSRLQNRIESLKRQQAEAEMLAREGKETYRLFEAQFRAGQRSVLEVVDIYEQSIQREMEGLNAKYDTLLAELQLARDLGLLANGDAI
ncbi:TolC family protein [Aliiruegeria sabulilitoris]|uniref:TolC family protein n=1 Tax=Aliiruegeria sabulilitoris TaxID=1510458 RepID=UPI000A5DD705|nr:TolC family protein [Aliiruegeria sabulilitoris]